MRTHRNSNTETPDNVNLIKIKLSEQLVIEETQKTLLLQLICFLDSYFEQTAEQEQAVWLESIVCYSICTFKSFTAL